LVWIVRVEIAYSVKISEFSNGSGNGFMAKVISQAEILHETCTVTKEKILWA
jgi:hypothetical protein